MQNKEIRNCYSKTTSIVTVKYFGKKIRKETLNKCRLSIFNILQILKFFQSLRFSVAPNRGVKSEKTENSGKAKSLSFNSYKVNLQKRWIFA